MSTTSIRRLLSVAVVASAALVATSAVAGAHVGAAQEAQPGGVTQVTFSFTHGCKDAPTTSLRIQLPAGTTAVTPQDPAGWTSTVTATELDWNGTAIPNGTKGQFSATMKLTGTAGDTVFFPTIQGCPGGLEETWIDKSTDPEAEHAAPRITLGTTSTGDAGEGHDKDTGTTEASGGGDHDADTGTSVAGAGTTVRPTGSTAVAATGTTVASGTGTTTRPGTTAPSATPSSSSNLPLIIAVIVIALAVIAAAGFALAKRSSPGSDSSSDTTT